MFWDIVVLVILVLNSAATIVNVLLYFRSKKIRQEARAHLKEATEIMHSAATIQNVTHQVIGVMEGKKTYHSGNKTLN
jgi:hypothetical protein